MRVLRTPPVARQHRGIHSQPPSTRVILLPRMRSRDIWPALLVHLFTASGAVLALFAARAILVHDWAEAFAWLGAALIVDAADGPLARRLAVEKRLPRFSGARLDLVIDYLTYVFLPALAFLEARLAGPAASLPLAALMVLTALYHFSDTASKTADGGFVGFPAIWNVVVFYLFAFDLSDGVAMVIVLAGAGLTFVPITWTHPIRMRVLRPVTLAIAALWAVGAVWTVWAGFPAPLPARVLLLLGATWAIGLTLWHGLRRSG